MKPHGALQVALNEIVGEGDRFFLCLGNQGWNQFPLSVPHPETQRPTTSSSIGAVVAEQIARATTDSFAHAGSRSLPLVEDRRFALPYWQHATDEA